MHSIKLILIILIFVGVAVLVIRRVLRPFKVEVYVENASLGQFNLTSTNTLYYNLKLDVSLNNQIKVIRVYYDKLYAYYGDERFGWVPLPSFYQGHKNLTVVYPVFSGQSVLVLSDLISSRFNEERVEGLFGIGIKIQPKMRFKIGHLNTTKFSPKVWCDLLVPLAPSTNSSSPSSGRTKCDVDYF